MSADFRASRAGRRQSWFGLKRVAKAFLGMSVPNAILRRIVRFLPPDRVARLPAPAKHFDSGVSVGFRTLDSVGEALPDAARVLVKVDVEGTENEVFRHGQAFLSRSRPSILCEVLAGVADPAELETLLAHHGYRSYQVREAALAPLDRLEPSPRFRDWLFSTEDPEALADSGIRLA